MLKKLERKNYPSIDSSYYCEWLSKDFLHWKIEGEILYIYGKGAMRDYRFYCSGEDDIEPPWYKKRGIKTVIIEEGVTYIGDYAFAYNKDIISINLPSTVVNMGESVFIGCDNLSSINVDKNNKVYISKNGVLYTYEMDEIIYCPSKSISETCLFPYGLERIGIQAFSNCKNLRFLNIVETVNYIDAGAFENCFNLEYVNIPSGIKEIRINAFHHCEKLKNIQLPKTVEKIDFGAFSTSGLIEIDIPAIDVCNCAFAGCKNLQKVRFSNKTEAILYNAFYFCMSLEEITLSRSINYIDPEAFELCVNLKNILFDGSKEDWDKKEYSILFPKEKYNIIFLKSEM